MESTRTVVRPARTIAPYVGGKRNLSKLIVSRLAKIRHALYAEPFIGMGGVFLKRPFRSDAEVINDISTDVVTLFRVLQRHYVPFLDMLKWQLTTRADFERLMATDPETLTDLERAARFLYVQRTGFGGKVKSRTFGVSLGPSRFDVTKLVPMLEAVHERLAGVTIERLPWSAFIERYDRAGTLFYLDPPYWGSEADYGKGAFARDDFGRMAEQLGSIKGRFVLSINDVPELRRLFKGFAIEPVSTTYSVGKNSTAPGSARELLISGRPRR